MAVTSATLDHLYLAYLGRPQDAYGARLYGEGDTMWQASQMWQFWESAEFLALTGTSDFSQQVDQVYQRLFNRAAEPAGLAYWQAEVQSGRLDARLLPIAILQGAQNADAVSVANKVAAAQAFTGHVDSAHEKAEFAGEAAAALARDFLRAVDSDPASVVTAAAHADDAVVQAVALGLAPGTLFFFTAAPDRIQSLVPASPPVPNNGFGVSTSGGDVFIASPIAGDQTVGDGDEIDGAGGLDTLVVTTGSGDVDTTPDSISNIEQVEVNVDGTAIVNLAGVTDLQALFVQASTPGLGGTATVRGFSTATPVALQLHEEANVVLEYSDRGLPDQSLVLDVSRLGGGGLSLPGIENVELRQAQWVGPISAPDAATVLVTGEGFLQLESVDLAPGGTLTIDFDGHVLAGNLGAGLGSTVILQGAMSGHVTIDGDVTTVISHSSEGVVIALDPTAPSGEIFVEANGGGAIQLFGADTARAIDARGGSKIDLFSGGLAADTFTGGSGTDDYVLSASSFRASDAAGLAAIADSIMDFGISESGGDRIWMPTTVAANHAGSSPGVASISAGFAAFDAADTTLAEKIAAAEAGITSAPIEYFGFAIFDHGGDSYLLVADRLVGINAGDMLVRLAGVAADPADFTFVIGVSGDHVLFAV
jgi:hypothetical protein